MNKTRWQQSSSYSTSRSLAFILNDVCSFILVSNWCSYSSWWICRWGQICAQSKRSHSRVQGNNVVTGDRQGACTTLANRSHLARLISFDEAMERFQNHFTPALLENINAMNEEPKSKVGWDHCWTCLKAINLEPDRIKVKFMSNITDK